MFYDKQFNRAHVLIDETTKAWVSFIELSTEYVVIKLLIICFFHKVLS